MKQIITQHGWALDQSFWDIYKNEFQEKNWNWQDNERGYFSKNINEPKWIKNNSRSNIKMVLCHSLGFQLIQKSILKDASHIVFINSFNNFLPQGKRRNVILRSLKRMEKKIITFRSKEMLREFIKRSFMPNLINISFQDIFYKSLESLNNKLLLEDFKKLYTDVNFPELSNKNCDFVLIQSEDDLILDREASNKFLEELKKKIPKKLNVIRLSNQGHCLTNINLYEIINSYLNI